MRSYLKGIGAGGVALAARSSALLAEIPEFDRFGCFGYHASIPESWVLEMK